ncbi:hypothetical protein [Streptomyces violaceus]|uniref:Uncharacterized protein n=1 Tax=Streptomyces violaceus TaxID=1936 RepID=A0ABY9U0M8_STRVL|nr:hypothetical protein [Streptomyces janthinus]WND15878.1 hypothetical protein RI060_00110 [Streptomyces janthinus]
MGGAGAAGDRGALTGVARRPDRRAAVTAMAVSGEDIGGREVGAGAVQACEVAPPAAGVAGDVDADLHDQLGCTSVTVNVWLVPHPAENDQPVHGCPGVAGASRPATALPVARARLVVRPVY